MTQTSRKLGFRKIRSWVIAHHASVLIWVLGTVSLGLTACLMFLTFNRPVLHVVSMQTGKNGVLTAKVDGVGTIAAADPAFAIDPSESMLVMTLTITNTSQQEQQFIPVTQLYVRSAEGNFSALHPSSHVRHPLPATDLKPGQSVKGEVTFAIPKDLAAPLLYVDTGWSSAPPIIIDIFH